MTDQEKIEFLEKAIHIVTQKQTKINPLDPLVNLSLDSLDIVELQIYYEDNTGEVINDDIKFVLVSDFLKAMK